MELEDLTVDATIELLSKCTAWTLLRVERTNSYLKSLVPSAFKRMEKLDLVNLQPNYWASEEKINWLINNVILRCGYALKSVDCEANILVKVWLTPGFPEQLAQKCPKIEQTFIPFSPDKARSYAATLGYVNSLARGSYFKKLQMFSGML